MWTVHVEQRGSFHFGRFPLCFRVCLSCSLGSVRVGGFSCSSSGSFSSFFQLRLLLVFVLLVGNLQVKDQAWVKSHHDVLCANGHSEGIRKQIKAKTITLTCSLGFLPGVSMGTSSGICSSSSSLFSTFSSLSPRDSVGLVTSSSLFLVLASLACKHTS